MSTYRIDTLPYANRHDILNALDAAVIALDLPTVNVTLDGGCEVLVRVTAPPERLGTHTPEPEDR